MTTFPIKPRSRRRHDASRMKARAQRIAKSWRQAPDHLLKMKDHLAYCSCMGCGNARKYEGRDMAELRSIDKMEYDLLDLNTEEFELKRRL